eukprot:scaffold234019_cov21-Tisochrysis_lutea.AAC.1
MHTQATPTARVTFNTTCVTHPWHGPRAHPPSSPSHTACACRPHARTSGTAESQICRGWPGQGSVTRARQGGQHKRTA